MRDRQWKAINNYPKLPRPGKGNMQLTLAKVRQNSSSAPSLSANDVQDHEGWSPWKNHGNRHPELVHTRFSQRYSGDDEESGHFNGKQIDTPPCLLKFYRTFHTTQNCPPHFEEVGEISFGVGFAKGRRQRQPHIKHQILFL